MRRLVAGAALVLAVAIVPAPLAAAQGTGTLKGAVYDTSCYGPCAYPAPPPPLYTGDSLVVVIRNLPDHALVAKLHPTNGRFVIDLAPGLYRVRAKIRDGGYCWRGETKRRQVVEEQVTKVRLNVQNACIV